MLPASLANGANQHQLARMDVRVAVVGLVRILGCIVGIHEVWHGTAIDQEILGMVGLGLYVETASRYTSRAAHLCRNLRLRLAVNSRIHLGPLEKVFAVVAGLGVIVSCRRKAEIGL